MTQIDPARFEGAGHPKPLAQAHRDLPRPSATARLRRMRRPAIVFGVLVCAFWNGLALAQTAPSLGWGKQPATSSTPPSPSPTGSSSSGMATQGNGAPGLGPSVTSPTPPLEAGGLVPPGAGEDGDRQKTTEKELERADREDAQRGLEYFWINGETGFQHVGLDTFRGSRLVDQRTVPTTGTGLTLGAGLGLRLVFLTLGPRFRYATFSDWKLWTLDGEAAFRFPLGKLEPYFLLAAGYSGVSVPNAGPTVAQDGLSIRGFNLRAGGGIDLYLSSSFSVGASVTGEMLFLYRSALPIAAPPTGTKFSTPYATRASSIGASITPALVVGLHF